LLHFIGTTIGLYFLTIPVPVEMEPEFQILLPVTELEIYSGREMPEFDPEVNLKSVYFALMWISIQQEPEF
jgi:hypothetical protein